MTIDLSTAVAPLRAEPARGVLLFDFDGTLSPVVDDPAAAVALPGVAERLVALAAVYRRVGVLSGRPVAFLVDRVPAVLTLSGLYGLETRIDGVVADHPDAQHWRPIVARVEAEARAATAPGEPAHGVMVEGKGLSLTLHVRTRPELADAVVELATRLAAPAGLEVRPAKMSVELHPPIDADKGTALEVLTADAGAVLYAGDDIGDLPAYAALDALAHRTPPATGIGVVVDGPELPAALRAPGRLVLPDQHAIIDLLDALLP
jgi:trehalose 6-phosphate phosphatase